MNVTDILSADYIRVDFSSHDKFEIINNLIDMISGDPRIIDIDETRDAIIDREEIQSTGVGNGFAIPHAKTDGVNGMIASFGRLPEPIEFESIDKQPVNLVFLMVAPESAVGPHIKMLSRISRMMSSEVFRESLAGADTSEEIYELFKTEEQNLQDIA
jgi:mannitol/fructose-specific phosphotransferase system IIA component (Ntr-type)